jgi:hypothetical protein
LRLTLRQFFGASAVQGRLVYGHKLTKPLTVRIIYSPGELNASLDQGTTEGKTKVVCTAPTGTAKYRLNPATRVVYSQSDTGFTAITTDPTVVVGDIIEVVDFVSSKAASVCYLTVTADVSNRLLGMISGAVLHRPFKVMNGCI